MEDIMVEENEDSIPEAKNEYKNLDYKAQQPGKFLCVDTRREKVTVETVPHQFRHNFSSPRIQINLNKQDSTVQPDSLCKLRTTLAVDYVRGLLEPIDRPSTRTSSRNLKKGPLKPLLGANQLKGPEVTRCLGIQNDRHKKSVVLEDGIRVPVEAISPASTRFSSANKRLQKDKVLNIDLRRLSLADQNCHMESKLVKKNAEETFCEPLMKTNPVSEAPVKNRPNSDGNRNRESGFESVYNCGHVGNNLHGSDSDNDGGDVDDIDCRINNDTGFKYDQDDDYVVYETSQRPYIDHVSDFKNDREEAVCICRASHRVDPIPRDQYIYKKVHSRNSKDYIATHEDGANDRSSVVQDLSKSHDRLLTRDSDSIQVKDIWKALNDGGLDISRGEVAKYKINSTKAPSRIKSAPAGRKKAHTRQVCRAKSACGRKDEKLSSVGERYTTDGGGTFEPTKTASLFETEKEKEKTGQDVPLGQNLEIVAMSKPVSKLPSRRKVISPSIPPTSFRINTRPRNGHFFYFAYGLNMNQKRLEIQLRRKAGERYWGLLFGFKLIFNKRGSSDGNMGFPNVAIDSESSVEGCVYEIPQECLSILDICVGFPKHYSRLVLPVWLCNSANPDEHGVAQHCLPAVVYVAQDEWVVADPEMLDSSFTFKQCLLGTDLLTLNYREFLSSLVKQ